LHRDGRVEDQELIASRQKAGLFERLMGSHGFPDETATVEAIRQRMP
jgi:hypothetical protein